MLSAEIARSIAASLMQPVTDTPSPRRIIREKESTTRKLSPAGQATAYLAANSVISACFAAAAPILGGLFADYFSAHELTLALTWKGGAKDVTVQVLNFQSWTFYFGITCVLGLYALHRLSFVEEPSGTTDRLALRDLLLEAGRWSAHSLSSAAGLLRIVRLPERFAGPENR